MNLYKTDSIVLNLDSFIAMRKVINIWSSQPFGIAFYTKDQITLWFDGEKDRDDFFNKVHLELQQIN